MTLFNLYRTRESLHSRLAPGPICVIFGSRTIRNGASGINPEGVLAIGSSTLAEISTGLTGTLVVITAAYAWLTWQISKRTADAADAATTAARASHAAAEAARRSALVSEASIPLQFSATPSRQSDGTVFIDLRVSGASVWLQAAMITGGRIVFHKPTKGEEYKSRQIAPTPLRVIEPDEPPLFPVFVPMDEPVSLLWPDSALRADDWGCGGLLRVSYSFAEDSEQMERRFSFELPETFWHDLNDVRGLALDKLTPRSLENPE